MDLKIDLKRACTGLTTSMSLRLPKHTDEDGFRSEGIPLKRQDSMRTPWYHGVYCLSIIWEKCSYTFERNVRGVNNISKDNNVNEKTETVLAWVCFVRGWIRVESV